MRRKLEKNNSKDYISRFPFRLKNSIKLSAELHQKKEGVRVGDKKEPKKGRREKNDS